MTKHGYVARIGGWNACDNMATIGRRSYRVCTADHSQFWHLVREDDDAGARPVAIFPSMEAAQKAAHRLAYNGQDIDYGPAWQYARRAIALAATDPAALT